LKFDLKKYEDLIKNKTMCMVQSKEGDLSERHITNSLILPGSFNPLHEGHINLLKSAEKKFNQKGFFEISLSNVDKNIISYKEVGIRLNQFLKLGNVIISNKAEFIEKSSVYNNCKFVIGYDTAERVLDNYYYKDNIEKGLSLINYYKCSFIVAGRKLGKNFKEVKHLSIPKKNLNMFQELTEKDFRSDISSTQLRQFQDKALNDS
jgi:nicotinic acid mononucleotide adenylyltransferase